MDRLELGVTGTVCENDACRPDDWVFDIAGVGPPPDAPISLLAEARILLPDAPTAGTPTEVTVILTPHADWEALPAPDSIVVRAREPRGPTMATATLPPVDADGLTYSGAITIPRTGELVLEAATDEDGGDATRFGTSMIRVDVGESAGGAAAGDPPGATQEEGMPVALVVLMALVAIIGAGVVLAGFRSGGR